MDTNNNTTDDQELAKVLQNMNQQTSQATTPVADTATPDATETSSEAEGLSFEETPGATPTASEPDATTPVVPEPAEAALEAEVPQLDAPAASDPMVQPSPELDGIKKTALEELRPLVDKLDLPADEKFDTLLLLIRSTDDKTLVGAAHEAARSITDETKRAQALLDVIKEIDYFSGHGANPAAAA